MEEILKNLVAFAPVTGDKQAIHEALEYIGQFLHERGMHVEYFELNDVESLVATTRGRRKTPKVLLAGHIDVVPAPEDAFALRARDGKLWGRGTLDMLGAIAAYLQLVDNLRGELEAYDFGIMITSDEEVGGKNGVQYLLEEGYRSEVCILPDGGNDPWALQAYSKGLWWLTITTTGKSAHASRPWEGESATAKLLDILQEIRQLFPAPTPDRSTLNVGVLSGGETPNQIAPTASARLDVRLASTEDDETLHSAIEAICQQHGATLTTQVSFGSVVSDLENHYLKQFASCSEEILGYQPGETFANASSDCRFFAAKGVPFVSFYPLGGNHHGNDEWLDQAALRQMAKIFTLYLQRTAKSNR